MLFFNSLQSVTFNLGVLIYFVLLSLILHRNIHPTKPWSTKARRRSICISLFQVSAKSDWLTSKVLNGDLLTIQLKRLRTHLCESPMIYFHHFLSIINDMDLRLNPYLEIIWFQAMSADFLMAILLMGKGKQKYTAQFLFFVLFWRNCL